MTMEINGSTSGTRNIAKYVFNTTDESGNTIQDKMTRDETLQTMNEITSQEDQCVIVEFSGDGLAALVEKKGGNLDEIMQRDESKQAAFDADIVQMENTHRVVIPNVQTNEKLYNSLSGADESAVKATTGIIKNYLLPSNVQGMSEEDRQSMIALGLEEAGYIAANYLNDEQSEEYLSTMETIAKYGMNGTVDENGKITYNIQKGPMVGAPDDYVNTMDILRSKVA